MVENNPPPPDNIFLFKKGNSKSLGSPFGSCSYSAASLSFFSSGQDTWHGLKLKEIKKERRCIQVNYVSFKTDWPVENL